MAKRFFKATIGDAVYFRASDSRVYASATVDGRHGGLTFSSKIQPAWALCTEIDKVEYNRLVALKAARVTAEGRDTRYANAPDNSWVAVEVAAGVVS